MRAVPVKGRCRGRDRRGGSAGGPGPSAPLRRGLRSVGTDRARGGGAARDGARALGAVPSRQARRGGAARGELCAADGSQRTRRRSAGQALPALGCRGRGVAAPPQLRPGRRSPGRGAGADHARRRRRGGSARRGEVARARHRHVVPRRGQRGTSGARTRGGSVGGGGLRAAPDRRRGVPAQLSVRHLGPRAHPAGVRGEPRLRDRGPRRTRVHLGSGAPAARPGALLRARAPGQTPGRVRA
jgi:hypothetical protein